jgi:Leucine-rich repeat (LRR) protein
MSSMLALFLSHNNFAGPIPNNQSFSLPLLQFFDLSQNNFVGPIPSGLATCKYLKYLYLAQNDFVDVVPTWLAQLPRLAELSLARNNIAGSIPVVHSNLTHLTALDLGTANRSDSKFSWEFFEIVSTFSAEKSILRLCTTNTWEHSSSEPASSCME